MMQSIKVVKKDDPNKKGTVVDFIATGEYHNPVAIVIWDDDTLDYVLLSTIKVVRSL